MKYLALIALLVTLSSGLKATTLGAGDLLFTGYFCNASTTDEFSFVLMVNISGTTVVSFTDNGWLPTNVFRAGEQTVTWTYTGTLVAGREIRIVGPSAGAAVAYLYNGSSGSTVIGSCSGSMASLATSGDQIIAYSGAVNSPTLIAGIHMNVYSTDLGQCGSTTAAAWDPTCIVDNANFSTMPSGLASGVSTIWIGTAGVGASEQDNAKFNCTGPLSTTAQLRASATNSANWTANSVAPPDMTLPSTCNFLGVLPLKLLSFNGNELDQQINLRWETAFEENHSYFEIEKSADGVHFSAIGRVDAQGGFSYITAKYQFQDKLPLQGMNYYRLKMVATNGNYDYSPLVILRYSNQGKTLFVSPNPVTSQLYVATLPGKYSTLVIYDLRGKAVVRQRLTQAYQIIDISHLPVGEYMLKTFGNKSIAMEKILIIR